MNPIAHLKINQKILLLIFIVSLVSTAAYSSRSYRMERDTIMEGINEKLLVSAYSVESILGKKFHEQIKDAHAQMSPAEYDRWMMLLTATARRYKVKYIYAVTCFGKSCYFSASSATEEELKEGTYDKFMQPYPEASEGLKQAVAARQIYYEEYEDKYGYDRSVYIPMLASGGQVYMLAADLPITFIRGRLRQSLVHSILIGAGIFVVIFVCGYFLVNMISRPLQNLARFTKELVSYDFKAPPEVDSGIELISSRYRDEVGNLAHSFLFMEHELQDYIEKVKVTTAAKERIESELRVAREIQMSVLPQTFPPFPHRNEFDIFATIEPAKEMSGDFYDFYLIDDDHVYFTIGDVSGKGVPASLFMVATRTLLEASANELTEPHQILNRVNTELSRKNESMMFVTVFYGILNVRSGQLDYANAGHNLPYFLHREGRVEFLGQTGEPALGVMDDFEYRLGRVAMQPGDCLFLYTDGVTEAMSTEGQEFTESRLEGVLLATNGAPVSDLIQGVVADVKAFAAGAPQSDDITALAIRFRGVDRKPGNAGDTEAWTHATPGALSAPGPLS